MATPAASSASVTGMRIRPCPMDCRASNKLRGTSRSPSVCPTGPTAFKDSARSLCERDSMAPDLSSRTSAAVASAGNTITECPCAVDAAHVCAALACSTLRKCSCQPSPDAATRGLAHSGVRLAASQLPPSSQLPRSNLISRAPRGPRSRKRVAGARVSLGNLNRRDAVSTLAIRAMIDDSRTRVTHNRQRHSRHADQSSSPVTSRTLHHTPARRSGSAPHGVHLAIGRRD